jgi:hypothetical protein
MLAVAQSLPNSNVGTQLYIVPPHLICRMHQPNMGGAMACPRLALHASRDGSTRARTNHRPSHIRLTLRGCGWHQVALHLEGDNAGCGLVYARSGQASIVQRLFEAVQHINHLAHTGWAEQHIVSCV